MREARRSRGGFIKSKSDIDKMIKQDYIKFNMIVSGNWKQMKRILTVKKLIWYKFDKLIVIVNLWTGTSKTDELQYTFRIGVSKPLGLAHSGFVCIVTQYQA